MKQKELVDLKKFLLEYKEKKGLNGAQLSKAFGVTPGTICHWMSGYSRPSFRTVLRIVYKTKGDVRAEDFGY